MLRFMLRTGAFLLGLLLPLVEVQTACADFVLTIQEYSPSGVQVGSTISHTANASDPGEVMTGSLMSAYETINGHFRVNIAASQNTATTGATPTLHIGGICVTALSQTSDYLVISVTEGGTGQGWSPPGSGSSLVLGSKLDAIGTNQIGGATVTLQSFVDTGDTTYGVPSGTIVPPSTSTILGPLQFAPGAVAAPTIAMNQSNAGNDIATRSNFTAGNSNYSITSVVTVSGLAVNNPVAFDSYTTVLSTPAPGALVLLASAVPGLGLAGWLRRRCRKASPC